MSPQSIPIFVINLDRREDRLKYMKIQLDQLGLNWERVSALDAKTATEAQISQEVDVGNTVIRMGRGSQCCAITNFDIFRKMVDEAIPAALILQDDIDISEDIKPYLQSTNWVPRGIGIVQFEKYGAKRSKRLAGPNLAEPAFPRGLHRLYSRTAGAGCYLITLEAAQVILDEKPRLRYPIDHFLFSPNISPIFHKVGVAIVTPAIARQKMEAFASDIAAERAVKKNIRKKLLRLWLEINAAPRQLWAMVKGARWIPFYFN